MLCAFHSIPFSQRSLDQLSPYNSSMYLVPTDPLTLTSLSVCSYLVIKQVYKCCIKLDGVNIQRVSSLGFHHEL